jgi:RNA polymerase sigma factor (sigma-70 family)
VSSPLPARRLGLIPPSPHCGLVSAAGARSKVRCYPRAVPHAEVEQARWFAEEVQPHEAALRAYLHAQFPSLSDVDDLVQEAYARLLRAYRAGKVLQARAYLFATARNAALDLFRREKIVPIDSLAEIDHLTVLEGGRNAAEQVSHDQELAILAEAVAALPPRCREILTLRRIEGRSHREIAEALGISEHTVNAQLAIAIVRCRKILRARGVLKGAAPAL